MGFRSEASGRCLGHEGRVFMHGISVLIRRDLRSCSFSALHPLRTQQEEGHLQRRRQVLIRQGTCWHLNVLPSLQDCEKSIFTMYTMWAVVLCNNSQNSWSDKWESQSRSVVSDSLRPHGLCSPWNSPSLNTGGGSLFLLQGIFPTQGLNPGLPHCRQVSTSWATREAPKQLKQCPNQQHQRVSESCIQHHMAW